MPKAETLRRARRDQRRGKSPSTQAGEFVREEIHEIRQGKHGARSTKQAIAIGLSKARRSGVKLPIPRRGTVPESTRRQALREERKSTGRIHDLHPSQKRSRATLRALKHESTRVASHLELSSHAKSVARQKTPQQRSASAQRASRTRTRLTPWPAIP